MTVAPTTATRPEPFQELVDRIELDALLSRLGAWLDGHGGDPTRLYGTDVVASGPRGRIEGIEAVIARVGPAQAAGERSQHFHTDVVIELDGDSAAIEANQLVQAFRDGELPHRTAGLRVTYGARREPAGWRIATAHIDLQWIVGDLPT